VTTFEKLKERMLDDTPGPGFYHRHRDVMWLITHLEKAIEMAEYYSSGTCALTSEEAQKIRKGSILFETDAGQKASDFLKELSDDHTRSD